MGRPKKNKSAETTESRPAKRTKLLSDAEPLDSDSEGESVGQVDALFKVNEEYAKRFEHNKKREEKHQLEEKYKKNGKQPPLDDDEDSDSTSEDEDDDGDLATHELDAEIFATLNAIKSKDPRVYDAKTTFYRPIDPKDALDGDSGGKEAKKEKPMYLSDYQRQVLLEGGAGEDADDDANAPPQTYAQEQEALKNSVVRQMHATADTADVNSADESDDAGFLVKKKKSTHDDMSGVHPSRRAKTKPVEVDVKVADKDPETFLSNFMAARAWVPADETSRFAPLESDDSDDERRAEGFEAAYNMRFEDPKSANEKLMSYGRDVGKYSARRDDLSGRKKQREKERAAKEAAKQERAEEKARLRKLKIEEVEDKVKRIREAAGLRAKDALDLDEWGKVLEEDWDDDRWEEEMQRKFGDNYYAEDEQGGMSDGDEAAQEAATKKSKAPKKPKWDDDIDIKDLLPEFEEDDGDAKPAFTLSDDDDNDDEKTSDAAAGPSSATIDNGDDAETTPTDPSTRLSKKARLAARADQKRSARKERAAIEDLVDNALTSSLLPSTSHKASSASSKAPTPFRYRETSPSSFGLTARDILFAEDAQLNEYAGLKKMAAFRDAEKKRRDKKKLGKKQRLRQWRKETFGSDEGFKGGFAEFLGEKGPGAGAEQGEALDAGAKSGGDKGDGGSRKRRGKKRKAAAAAE